MRAFVPLLLHFYAFPLVILLLVLDNTHLGGIALGSASNVRFPSPCPAVFVYDHLNVPGTGKWRGHVVLPNPQQRVRVFIVFDQPVASIQSLEGISVRSVEETKTKYAFTSTKYLEEQTPIEHLNIVVHYDNATVKDYPAVNKIKIFKETVCDANPQKPEVLPEKIKEKQPPSQAAPRSWTASVFSFEDNAKDKKYRCDGSLIARKLVLTTAACVHKRHPNRLLVVLGSDGSRDDEDDQQVDVQEVLPRDGYDISVLQLAYEVDRRHTPVDLWLNPGPLDFPDNIGRLTNRRGSETAVTVLPPDVCLNVYNSMDSVYLSRRYSGVFCGRCTSDCLGQSLGSALVMRPSHAHSDWFLRGVLSHVVANHVLFTDVATHSDWIRDHINRMHQPQSHHRQPVKPVAVAAAAAPDASDCRYAPPMPMDFKLHHKNRTNQSPSVGNCAPPVQETVVPVNTLDVAIPVHYTTSTTPRPSYGQGHKEQHFVGTLDVVSSNNIRPTRENASTGLIYGSSPTTQRPNRRRPTRPKTSVHRIPGDGPVPGRLMQDQRPQTGVQSFSGSGNANEDRDLVQRPAPAPLARPFWNNPVSQRPQQTYADVHQVTNPPFQEYQGTGYVPEDLVGNRHSPKRPSPEQPYISGGAPSYRPVNHDQSQYQPQQQQQQGYQQPSSDTSASSVTNVQQAIRPEMNYCARALQDCCVENVNPASILPCFRAKNCYIFGSRAPCNV